MPTPRRTIRLFVSSTFADLKAERDALQNRVYPRLRALCQEHNLRFQAIDLRWGVSEEAGRHNRTLRICLRELKSCQQDTPKPNFLILLGDRYGWRPLPETIPAGLFEKIARQVGANYQTTEALLRAHYRLDENADPATWVIQPRPESGGGEIKDWIKQVEQPLLSALVQAAQQLGSEPGLEKLCLGLSATHQEILHGALNLEKDDAREHVHAFFREIRRTDKTPLPIEFADAEIGPTSPIGKLKDEIKQHLGNDNVHRCPMDWEKESFAEGSLQKFADDVYEALKNVVDAQIKKLESLPLEDQERNAHEQFAAERTAGFRGRSQALKEIADYLEKGGDGKALAVVGAPGSGKSTLLAKAAEEAKYHYGKSAFILDRYIGVTPGSGELGSLLRNLVRAIRQKYPLQAAKAPTEVGPLYEKPKPSDGEIPFELNPLINAFHEALQRPGADQPLLLFVDALDQFSAGNLVRELYWLPASIPTNVRLVVSAALPPEDAPANDPRREVLRALENRPVIGQRIELGKLSREEGEKLLHHWLTSEDSWPTGGQRKLQPTQQDALLDAFAIEGNPLWLRAATAEAAQWSSWETDHSKCPTKVSDLLRQVLDHLAQAEEHGEVLVQRALGYLASARHGLAEDELIDVLSRDEEVMKDFIARSTTERIKPKEERIQILPVAVWVRLRGDLDPYLTERDAQGASLLNFYHRSFLDAVRARCLSDNEVIRARHLALAEYFHSQDNWRESLEAQRARAQTAPPTPRPANLRKIEELPWHRLEVLRVTPKDADEFAPTCTAIEELLLGPFFLEAKTEGGEVFALAGDFKDALALLPDDRPQRRFVRLYEEALRREIHFVARHPTTLFQVMWNLCWWYDCPEAKYHYDQPISTGKSYPSPDHSHPILQHLLESWRDAKSRVQPNFTWIRSLRPPEPAVDGSLLFVLTCLGDKHISPKPNVTGIAISQDGQRIFTADHKAVYIWSAENGINLRRIAIPCNQRTTCTAISPDENCVACSGRNHLIAWRIDSGKEPLNLLGHTNPICKIVFSLDGQKIISASRLDDTNVSKVQDYSVRVWDTETGLQLVHFIGSDESINSIAISPDGTIIASGGDRSIQVWDARSAKVLFQLNLPGTRYWGKDIPKESYLLSLAFSTDSARLLIGGWHEGEEWSNGYGPGLWHLYSKDEPQTFCGHEWWVDCVAFSPKGTYFATGSSDCTVRIWNARECKEIRCLRGHKKTVNKVLFSSDEQTVISASEDGTVRVWNLALGQEKGKLHGHGSGQNDARGGEMSIQNLVFSEDGTKLISSAADRKAILWENKTGRQLLCLEHDGVVKAAAFSADGRLLATACGKYEGAGANFSVWNISTGKRVFFGKTGREGDAACSVAFSHDSRYLVGCTFIGDIRLWNIEREGRLVTMVKDYAHYVGFWPEARILIGVEKSTIKLWTVEDELSPTGSDLSKQAKFRIYDGICYAPECKLLRKIYINEVIHSVELSVDGEFIIVESISALSIWNIHTGVREHVSDCQRMPNTLKNITSQIHDANNGKLLPLERGVTTYIDNAMGAELAWYPAELEPITGYSKSRLWAGAEANHLHLIMIESG